jgi:type IV secretion system protein VirB8
MSRKESSTNKIDDSIARSVNFELTIADIAKRSERRAWWVAFGAIIMALILAGGYFYMLPLKEKVPYIVMADAYTGTSTVSRLTEDFTNRRISTSEAINRSNIAHFVLARESYDVAMMNLHDWATTLTMSSPGVAAAYTSLYATSNPDSPYKTYGPSRAIRVKILSIVLIGAGPNMTPKGATVRFQRNLYDKQTGVTRYMDSKIATLEFVYKSNLKMDDQSRIENPLGFQITNYKVDSDYDSTPPGESQGSAIPSADAPAPSQTAPSPQIPQSPMANGDETLPQGNLTQPASIPLRPPMPEHEDINTTSAHASAPAAQNHTHGANRP